MKKKRNMDSINSTKKTFLFIAYHPTSLHGMAFLAEQIADRYPDYEVIMACVGIDYVNDKFKVRCFNTGINALLHSEYTPREDRIYKEVKAKKKVVNCPDKGIIPSPFHYRIFLSMLFWNMWEKRRGRKLLKSVSPSAVVVYMDRVGIPFITGVMNAAKEKKIKVIDVQTSASIVEQTVEDRAYREDYVVPSDELGIKSWIAKKYPASIQITSRGTKVSFYPFEALFAGMLTGMLSKRPWYDGMSQWTTHMLCASREYEEFLKKHAPNVDARAVGMAENGHVMYLKNKRGEIARTLRKKYGFEGNINIFNCPKRYEQGFVDWETHKNNISKLVKVASENLNFVIVSLHPKAEREKYGFIENISENVKICDERLADIIPASDFVLTYTSSILDWLIICDIDCAVYNDLIMDAPISEEKLNEIRQQIKEPKKYKADSGRILAKDSVAELVSIVDK